MAAKLGAPHQLVNKTPTADLETLRPLHPDEAAMGVSYEAIDDLLEVQPVHERDAPVIVATYRRTAHKGACQVIPERGPRHTPVKVRAGTSARSERVAGSP